MQAQPIPTPYVFTNDVSKMPIPVLNKNLGSFRPHNSQDQNETSHPERFNFYVGNFLVNTFSRSMDVTNEEASLLFDGANTFHRYLCPFGSQHFQLKDFLVKAIPSMKFTTVMIKEEHYDAHKMLSHGGLLQVTQNKPDTKHFLFSILISQASNMLASKHIIVLCMWKK